MLWPYIMSSEQTSLLRHRPCPHISTGSACGYFQCNISKITSIGHFPFFSLLLKLIQRLVLSNFIFFFYQQLKANLLKDHQCLKKAVNLLSQVNTLLKNVQPRQIDPTNRYKRREVIEGVKATGPHAGLSHLLSLPQMLFSDIKRFEWFEIRELLRQIQS